MLSSPLSASALLLVSFTLHSTVLAHFVVDRIMLNGVEKKADDYIRRPQNNAGVMYGCKWDDTLPFNAATCEGFTLVPCQCVEN